MLHRPDLGFQDEGQDLASPSFYAGALGRLGEARVLPPAAFRSLRFSQLEDEAIWTRDWICVGAQEQIPLDGDLLPFTVGTHGIHVQRVKAGLVARFNKAQHGGCRSIPLQCQTGKKTKCSFTSCGYSRDRGAIPARELGNDTPEMQQYLGLRPERLLTGHAAAFGSLIFVNLDIAPASHEGAFRELNEAGGFFNNQSKLSASGSLEYTANWKLLGQHLAAGKLMSESESDDWLLARTAVETKPSLVAWLFPNLVLMRTEDETCVIVLQQTALDQTLCRYFIYSVEHRDASSSWTTEIGARAAKAALDHREAVRWGTNFRPETIDAELPLQSNPQGLWIQRMIARRAVRTPTQPFAQPLFQHARG